MKRISIVAILLLLAGCAPWPTDDAPDEERRLPVVELANGRWFMGGGFEAREMYVEDGVLREGRPAHVNSVIDLEGGYVVPPFGEGHTHRPADPQRASPGFFLDRGIFYVMNHGNLARHREALGGLVNRPDSVDALFANALLASPQSHGVELWQRLAARGAFPGVTADTLDEDAFFVVESREDLERRWPAILATGPDFIKIMVEHSEEYELRRADPRYFGKSGLDPALITEIVSLARDAGLRVSAHIETAADFHAVVAAGVDVVAHLPGYDIPEQHDLARYRIDRSDAERAADRGTIVVTTTLLSTDRAEDEPARLGRMQANQRHNLRLLAEAGVPLAIGSDQFSQSSVAETMNLASLGVFDNATLLKMLSSATPRAIFPKRRIGELQDGAEASFLVLKGDPLEDLSFIREISLRFKDGGPLPSPAE